MLLIFFTWIGVVQANVFSSATTFCVGGFNLNSPSSMGQHACNKTSIVQAHPACWHQHTSVIRNIQTDDCYICWDECDSSCDWDFMSNNPNFQQEYDPSVCKHSDAQEVFQHVKNGVELDSTTANTGTLTPEIVIRKGPYAAGETVQIEIQLKDGNHQLAKDDGQIIIPDQAVISLSQDGTTLTQVQGYLSPDGTLIANIQIPQSTSWRSFFGLSENYDIQVDVSQAKLPTGYSFSSTETSISVTTADCIHQLSLGFVNSTIVSSLPLKLKATMIPNDMSNAQLEYIIKVTDSTALKTQGVTSWSVKGDANGEAIWTPPELTQSFLKTPLTIYVTGVTQNGANICPSAVSTFTLSGQSILPEVLLPIDDEIILTDVPPLFSQTKYCITGESCSVQIAFKGLDNANDPVLQASDAQVRVLHNSGDVLYQGSFKEEIKFEFLPKNEGTITPKIQISSTALQKTTSLDASVIEVRDPINLGLPDPMNFGFVDTDNWRSKCQIFNMNHTRLRPNDGLRFQVTNMPSNCNMNVLYLNNPTNMDYFDGSVIPLDEKGNGYLDLFLPKSTEFGFCIQTDACGALDSDGNTEIAIIPLDLRLRRFQNSAIMEWTSQKNPFWAWGCWGKIMTLTGSLLSLLLLTYGYVKAPRFAYHQEVKVSTSKNMSQNTRTYQLGALRSRRLILFKGERVSFDANLLPSKKYRAITCLATSYGFEVSGKGLQEYNVQKKSWDDVEGTQMLASSKLYRLSSNTKYYIKFYS